MDLDEKKSGIFKGLISLWECGLIGFKGTVRPCQKGALFCVRFQCPNRNIIHIRRFLQLINQEKCTYSVCFSFFQSWFLSSAALMLQEKVTPLLLLQHFLSISGKQTLSQYFSSESRLIYLMQRALNNGFLIPNSTISLSSLSPVKEPLHQYWQCS